MGTKAKLITIGACAFTLVAAYLLIDLDGIHWEYVLTRRLLKVGAVILTGSCIAFATVVFQAITNNRILTPSIIGMDSLFLLLQTAVVFVFGAASLFWANPQVHFALSAGLMIGFAGLLYQGLFRRETFNIYFILLIGLILGTLFQSLSSFMQMLIDPNEFLVVQGRMFGSFNNVRTDLLIIATALVAFISAFFLPIAKYLDVLALGRDSAINLGVNYNQVVKRLWIIVAGLIAVATALVGPITFLGLLVANMAHELFKTHRQTILIAGSILLSVVALMGALLLVERVFTFTTTVSVIINFLGSIYFLYIVLQESQASA